jgi:hypothetical protein
MTKHFFFIQTYKIRFPLVPLKQDNLCLRQPETSLSRNVFLRQIVKCYEWHVLHF